MSRSSSSPSRTILVADDEPIVRTVVCRLLEEWDFQVLEASNGEEALRVARGVNGSLSMVITDVTMPVMDGYEFVRLFRPLYPSVPILFITGHSPGALESLGGRGEHLLFKPFGPDIFLETVARLLEDRVNATRSSA